MRGQFIPYKDENVSETFPHITLSLIVINVVIFIWSLTNFQDIIFGYGFIPAEFVIITIFTSMFLHGGFDHLFGNMLFLYIYGDNVEDKYGKVKYLALYILSGIFAALVHWLSDPSSAIPTIGASGAISGILGSYLVMFPRVRVRTVIPLGFFFHVVRLPVYFLVGFWFFMQLLFATISFVGGVGSGIAFFAHVGGFVFGYIVTRVFRSRLLKKGKKEIVTGFFRQS